MMQRQAHQLEAVEPQELQAVLAATAQTLLIIILAGLVAAEVRLRQQQTAALEAMAVIPVVGALVAALACLVSTPVLVATVAMATFES
jgi:hypothetical protein